MERDARLDGIAMFQPLHVPNFYSYSQLPAGQTLIATVHLVVTEAGNILIDPLPLDVRVHEQIEQLGGVSKAVVMTKEREPEAEAIAVRYRAAVVKRPKHRELLLPGIFAITLPDQRSGHEFAVSIPAHRTVVAGDALVGSPAGALSLPPEGEYTHIRRAALGLRRILRENPRTLLVAQGQSIFADAYDALYELLYSTAGAEVHRINIDELDYRNERDERVAQPPQYHSIDAEVGSVIGARRLGYRVNTLAPGQRFCPLHAHARSEEMFFVLDGAPSIRTLSGTIRCRKGDFIAFPVGETGTHQLLNESDAPATVLLLGREDRVESCYYPDSDKLLVEMARPYAKGRDALLVRGSPELDYFDGET
jgi:uncharacterized cupin superfamily protein